jgi:hypothetical protein
MGIAGGPDMIQDGLVLLLDTNDINSYPGSGTTWFDISGYGYNHTLTNTSLTTFKGVRCFDFSSIGYARPTSTTYTFTQNYTMLAWASALSDAEVATWRTLWRTTPDDHPILIQDGTDLLGYYDNNNAGFVSFGATLSGLGLTNKWTMFTLTGTGGSTNLYYDSGSYVGSVAYSANNNSHDLIGSAGGSQAFGYVATAVLYNRALSASEILQNYNAQKSRFNL